MKRVAIVSTGSELVYGKVHEANCFYLSNKIFPTVLEVVLHITVGDQIENLEYAVREAMSRSDITIITGGLGPTDDDCTLEVLKGVLGFESVINEAGKRRMEIFFNSINRSIMENDLKQVSVPYDAEVFDNDIGLAVGYSYVKDGKNIIAMPGVPREMHYMFENKVFPFLIKNFGAGVTENLPVRIVLMREAEVNGLVKNMDINFENIGWGITTSLGMNTVTFVQKPGMEFPVQRILQESLRVFGDRMLLSEYESLEMEVVSLLNKKGMTISLAESCTGGLVSKRITDIPGSSEVFLGGVVAYSNNSKINILGVSGDSIRKYGSVSEIVAKEMAQGVRNCLSSNIGISITGIAGPGGGGEEKPVGMVCFSIATPDKIESFTTEFIPDRERIRFFSSQYALDMVRRYVKGA